MSRQRSKVSSSSSARLLDMVQGCEIGCLWSALGLAYATQIVPADPQLGPLDCKLKRLDASTLSRIAHAAGGWASLMLTGRADLVERAGRRRTFDSASSHHRSRMTQ